MSRNIKGGNIGKARNKRLGLPGVLDSKPRKSCLHPIAASNGALETGMALKGIVINNTHIESRSGGPDTLDPETPEQPEPRPPQPEEPVPQPPQPEIPPHGPEEPHLPPPDPRSGSATRSSAGTWRSRMVGVGGVDFFASAGELSLAEDFLTKHAASALVAPGDAVGSPVFRKTDRGPVSGIMGKAFSSLRRSAPVFGVRGILGQEREGLKPDESSP